LQNLKSGIKYFWRVIPVVNGTNANSSETWSFTTETITVSSPINGNLVGHWKLDEGLGNTFIDHSGKGNNASIPTPSGISWTSGKVGQAALFNSTTGAFGVVANNPSIDLTEELTISAWIRPNAIENKGILTKLSGDGYEFRIFSDGKLEFRINRSSEGTTYKIMSNQKYVADGRTWTHVAVTFNGTNSTLYINGEEDNFANFNLVTIKSNTSDLRIGAVGNGNRWNGGLDDIRLYNKALTKNEISSLYENSDFSISQTNLEPVGYWKMDEGNGNSFVDNSAKGNNAAILNPSGINWTSGKIGQSAVFSGNLGAYGSVPHNPSIDITDQITITAWIRPNAIENKGILTKLNGDGYELRIFSDGKLEFRINRASAGTTYKLTSKGNYVADGKTWTHVAVTFNGTNSTIYINGSQDNSQTYQTTKIISTDGNLTIGSVGAGNRWNGLLDEIRLYDRALTPSEILNIYTGNNIVARTTEILDENKTKELNTELGNENIDLSRTNDLKIYPNPVIDKLNIQWNSDGSTLINMSIYDLIGRQYFENTSMTENGQIMIDLEGIKMSPGVYILILDNGLIGMKKIKFIKK
jgi:hypothetical protein